MGGRGGGRFNLFFLIYLFIYFSILLSRYDELDASGVGLDPERKQKSLGQIQVLRNTGDTGGYTGIQEDTRDTQGYRGIPEGYI